MTLNLIGYIMWILLLWTSKKKLNFLKVIAGVKWGGDANTLLGIYQSLILSKLDYACEVYGAASRSTLKRLDTIHHSALRYCLGAFRTTPTASLCAETGLMPLVHRRLDRIATYVIRIEATPEHPIYDLWHDGKSDGSPSRRRVREYINSLGDTRPVLTDLIYETPPWAISEFQVDMSMALFPKAETPKEIYQQKFEEIVENFTAEEIIYTDGSMTEYGVGSAFVAGGIRCDWTLCREAAVVSAEAWAIVQALNYCQTSHCRTFMVASDSLFVLKKLTLPFTRHCLISIILNKVEYLKRTGKDVKFVWIPSHMEIGQNEIADSIAKRATMSPNVDIEALTKSDKKKSLKSKINQVWLDEWLSAENWLVSHKRSVNPWAPPAQLNRQDRIKIERLRLGHSRITIRTC